MIFCIFCLNSVFLCENFFLLKIFGLFSVIVLFYSDSEITCIFLFFIGELYSKFILILHKLLNKSSGKHCLDIPLDVNDIVPASSDPLLSQKIFNYNPTTERFFRPEVNPVYMPVTKIPPEVLFTELQICTVK